MNKRTFSVGVVGLGDCSKRFIPQLALHGGLRMVTAADIVPQAEKRELLEGMLQQPVSYIRIAEDKPLPEKVFNNLDAIFISSPNNVHLSQTKQALEHRLLVVTEKPLVMNEHQLDELANFVKAGQAGTLFAQDHYSFKPGTIYMQKRLPELVAQYGKITSIDVAFLEKGNLTGLDREKWLLSRSAVGGGMMLDTGTHMSHVLNKVAGVTLGECVDAAAFTLYPQYNFECETGAYATYAATGNLLAPSLQPQVTIRVAKGIDQQAKRVSFTLEQARVTLDYDANEFVINRRDSETREKITGPHEYFVLANEMHRVLADGSAPPLTLDTARKSLMPVFNFYKKLGGIEAMTLHTKADAKQFHALVGN